MKKEDLITKGLTEDQAVFVMSEWDKEINPIKAERGSYKGQLSAAQASLESMKGVDVGSLQTKITELTTKLQGKDGEIERMKADYAFDTAVKAAIRKASGRNEKAIMALLDIDALKASKNQEVDIQAALDTLKKDNDYLFQDQKIPKVVSITPGIDPDAQTKRERANEALRSLFGKE